MLASSTRVRVVRFLLRALPIAALALSLPQTPAAAAPSARLALDSLVIIPPLPRPHSLHRSKYKLRKWGDADRDGLRNWTEIRRTRTNPRKADTDGDGLSDWTEVKRTKTNPRKADADGDGVSDGEEIQGPEGSSPPNGALTPGEIEVVAETAGIVGTAGLLETAPSCDGVEVTPEDNLRALINEEGEETTFCLQEGTYEPSEQIIPKNHDSFIGAQSGVVFDGKEEVGLGLFGHGATSGAYVTVENMTFKGFTEYGIYLEQNATINHIEVTGNQKGVWTNIGSTLEHSYIHDNLQYGIAGGPGEGADTTIENNDFYHNNTSENCGGDCNGDAGMSKWVGPEAGYEGLVLKHNYIHGNIGNAIWEDIGVTGSTIEWNLVKENTGSGIKIELSSNAVVAHNTVINNDEKDIGASCGRGAQIQDQDSKNVEVAHNTVIADNGANGICAYDSDRDPESEAGVECPCSEEVKDFNAHDNIVYLKEDAITGLGGRESAGEEEAENNLSDNTYYLADTEGEFWTWPSGRVDWDGWQALGQDTLGTLHAWE